MIIKIKNYYYSYDGHYFYTDYAVMIEDYQNGNRNRSINASQPYYNYFQYLPLRSESNYSAEELNAMIQSRTGGSGKLVNTANIMMKMQNTYGVNALTILSVAANESGWGKSSIAQNKNNLFGLNAIDASPSQSANSYASVESCIKDFAETYMSKRYLRAGYTYYKGGFLGNKASGINVSYASDPYWGEKAAAIMWGLDSARKDQLKYTIGVKDLMSNQHTDLSIRKEADASSTRLYATGQQSSHAFLLLDTSGNFYRIQSDPVLDAGRTAVNTSTGNYNFGSMYAYASKDYITVVSGQVDEGGFSVSYNTHIQTYGWRGYQKNGATSGTEGEAKRLEAIKIQLNNAPYPGSVSYQTHVQTYGWLDSVSNNEVSGTEGEAKRLEAIRISLTGELANHYDIYYRVHAQTFGWLGWAKNGENAGSAGYAKRLEAIQIVLVEKGKPAPGSTGNAFKDGSGGSQGVTPHVRYRTHVQTYGWQPFVIDGAESGTTAQAKRLESIIISMTNKPTDGSLQYRTHVQTHGWLEWASEGNKSGTEGQAKRLEAIEIRLTGDMEKQYDIYYRVHAQTYGWLGWARNGESAGTEGLAKRLEAIQIVLVKKGGAAPGDTERNFIKK